MLVSDIEKNAEIPMRIRNMMSSVCTETFSIT
jgi:hypothetical protein